MWALRIGMAVTIAVLTAVVGILAKFLLRQHERSGKLRCVFEDEAASVFGLCLPKEPLEEYETLKTSIFQNCQKDLNLSAVALKVDMKNPPNESWMRKLPPQVSNPLKAMLMKRGMGVMPLLQTLPKVLETRHGLHSKGLINDQQWMSILKFKTEVEIETDTVEYEAECLVAGWGVSKQVFKDSLSWLQQQNQYKMMEKQKQMAQARLNSNDDSEIIDPQELIMPSTLREVQQASQKAMTEIDPEGVAKILAAKEQQMKLQMQQQAEMERRRAMAIQQAQMMARNKALAANKDQGQATAPSSSEPAAPVNKNPSVVNAVVAAPIVPPVAAPGPAPGGPPGPVSMEGNSEKSRAAKRMEMLKTKKRNNSGSGEGLEGVPGDDPELQKKADDLMRDLIQEEEAEQKKSKKGGNNKKGKKK